MLKTILRHYTVDFAIGVLFDGLEHNLCVHKIKPNLIGMRVSVLTNRLVPVMDGYIVDETDDRFYVKDGILIHTFSLETQDYRFFFDRSAINIDQLNNWMKFRGKK